MFHFHRWTKWGKPEEYRISRPKNLSKLRFEDESTTAVLQTRECKKCGEMQSRQIGVQ